jgi:hypothetical protein
VLELGYKVSEITVNP